MKKILFLLILAIILLVPLTLIVPTNHEEFRGTAFSEEKTFETFLDYQREFPIKVLFDNGHNQYYNASRLSQFLRDIERTFWVEVDINYGQITSTLLSGYDVLILTNPQASLSADEVSAIKNFVADGGALLICGDYYAYFDPAVYNNITSDFGIEWYDVSVYDDTNYDYANYYPIIHTWETNSISNFVSDSGKYEIKYSGTALRIVNTSVYVVGTGDSDTYAKDSGGTTVLSGTNVVVFAAVDLPDGGRIFASGGSSFLRSNTYLYLNFNFDNKFFALSVFEWLLKGFVGDIFDLVSSTENITTFASPDSAYSTLENYIMSANETLYIMVYQFTHPLIYNMLAQLKQQKPNVKIIAVIQENHTAGQDDDETRYIADKLVDELGATVKWANEDIYSYTHAKMIIIDNKTILIGTGNLKDVNLPTNNTFGNRDLYIIIRNQYVVDLFLEVFLDDLNLATPYSAGTTKQDTYGDTGTYQPKFSTETFEVEAKFIPLFAPEGVYYHLKHLIRRAKHFIYLYIPYASSTSLVTELISELGDAVNRGVTVLAITNDYDTKTTLENLGVNVIYTPSDLVGLHAKAMIIDDKIVAIHSSNWSTTGLGVANPPNREAGLGIMSVDIATYYRDVFGYDWERKTGSFDSDGDGLCDLYENDHNLNASNVDTDEDGYTDWEEVVLYDSDPLNANSPGSSNPSIIIVSPENNSVLNTSTVKIVWNSSDDDGIDYSEIKLDDGSWINVGNATEHTFYNLSDGKHTVYIRTFDTRGNYNTSLVVFNISEPPKISLNDPVEDDDSNGKVAYTSSSTIVLGWEATDNSGMDHVEISVDGEPWKNIGLIECYVVSGLSEGNHTIRIKLVDINGLYNITNITVIVDSTPPTINANNSYVSSTISWSASDNVDIDYYMIRIGSGDWIYLGKNTTYEVPDSLLDGTYTLYIKAVDKSGNYNITRSLLIIDKTKPQIIILNPENNSYISTQSITISWSINEDNLKNIQVAVDSEIPVNIGKTTSHTINLVEGTHTIKITAYDITGNNATTKIVVTVDTTPPTIISITPEDGETLKTTTVNITWNATDNNQISYYLVKADNAEWIRTTSDWITINLSVGVHTITIVAIDSAGNTHSKTIVITIQD